MPDLTADRLAELRALASHRDSGPMAELLDEIDRLKAVAASLAKSGVPLVAAARGLVRCPLCGAKTRFSDYGDVDDSENRWRKMHHDPTWHYETCPFRMAREVTTDA